MTPPDDGGRRSYGPDFLTELFLNPLDPGYADAAGRRAQHGPPSRRQALSARTVAVLTLVAVGFLLAVAYRQTMADEPERTQARAALTGQIQARRAETDQMQGHADELRSQVAQLRERELGRPAAERIRNLEATTGLARVHGDGVTVRLGDGHATVDPVTGQRTDVGRVQDRDLQLVANALWAAGAEAIAINGQRLTATSTIRLAGEAILVDLGPVSSPYDVVAVGPDDLAQRFGRSPTARLFRQLGTEVGMAFDVREVTDVTLPAAAQPRLRFASPSASPSPPAATPSTEGPTGDPTDSPDAVTPTAPSGSPSEGGR